MLIGEWTIILRGACDGCLKGTPKFLPPRIAGVDGTRSVRVFLDAVI
jgi:hypothetical protein